MPEIFASLVAGSVSGIISMMIYRKLSDQNILNTIAEKQKKSRAILKIYDGDMRGLYALIAIDLGITLTQIRKVFMPAMLSLLPCIGLLFFLSSYFHHAYFEVIYVISLAVTSLYIKIKYKLAKLNKPKTVRRPLALKCLFTL